ncbi:MAG: ribosome-associated translation inhibitor RaiA [Alistipes sp.]|nr:ribosome-associated translation inhibitor RaiA [Alistipes sp.]
MLPEFIRYLEAERRYSPLTVRNYRRDVEQFLAWLGTDDKRFNPRQVTTGQIREWIIHRTEEGRIGAGTMNREISSLRALFRWLHRTGAVEKDILRPLASLKTAHRLPAFVPESRMSAIVRECESESNEFETARNSLVVLLLYTCGLRLAELVGIDRDHLSADCRSLRVRGKGDKQRIVPILDEIREKILHYLEVIERQQICSSEEKALFLTGKGKRISRMAVYRLVQDELTRAGVQGKKSPHVLRHTFATHLMNGGADMREIQELLGHASLQATQVYTHNSIARLKEIYAKAHPREQTGEQKPLKHKAMNVQIQSVKFDADKRLVEFVQAKMAKLERFAERATGAEVILKLDKDSEKGNKIATLTLRMPGEELLAERQAKTFEEAVDEAIDALKRQLDKFKGRSEK